MTFELSEQTLEIRDRVVDFMEKHVYPVNHHYHAVARSERRNDPDVLAFVDDLRAQVYASESIASRILRSGGEAPPRSDHRVGVPQAHFPQVLIVWVSRKRLLRCITTLFRSRQFQRNIPSKG